MGSVKIGLIGGGTVALSFLQQVKNVNIPLSVSAILVENKSKSRNFNRIPFTCDLEEFKRYPFDILVDASSGGVELWPLFEWSLKQRKPLISANKKLLVDKFDDFHDLARETQTPLLYEAACAAAIPILKTLNDYYSQIPIKSIKGIINGSCNYILSEMEKGLSFNEALNRAQKKGYAETDPYLDVSGEDARNKLLLLIYHAFGQKLSREEVELKGISALKASDFIKAKSLGKTIKLIAEAKLEDGKVFATVKPMYLDKTISLAQASGAQNIIEVESFAKQNEFFLGEGAGGVATTLALTSDVIAAINNYKYKALLPLDLAFSK